MLRRNLLLGIVLMFALACAHATDHTVTVGPNNTLTFSPATVTIAAGDTVTFRNSTGSHNVASDTGLFRCATSCSGSGGNVSGGAWSSTVTFNNPGTFGYFCEAHGSPGAGMAGKVVVTGSALPDYSIAADAGTLGVTQGSSASVGITLTPQNGFSGNVTYSASGLPAGVTATFTPQSATHTNLTFAASGNATTGDALVQIQATSGNLSHTANVTLTVNAASAFVITPGITGSWYNPAQSGHGFNLEVINLSGNNVLLAYWYVFDNSGNNLWVGGLSGSAISGNSATVNLNQTQGGMFPPNFDKTKITKPAFGTLTFSFTDCNTGTATWNPGVAGFPSGTMPIQRITSVSGFACP